MTNLIDSLNEPNKPNSPRRKAARPQSNDDNMNVDNEPSDVTMETSTAFVSPTQRGKGTHGGDQS